MHPVSWHPVNRHALPVIACHCLLSCHRPEHAHPVLACRLPGVPGLACHLDHLVHGGLAMQTSTNNSNVSADKVVATRFVIARTDPTGNVTYLYHDSQYIDHMFTEDIFSADKFIVLDNAQREMHWIRNLYRASKYTFQVKQIGIVLFDV
jgi:hypothetical protein